MRPSDTKSKNASAIIAGVTLVMFVAGVLIFGAVQSAKDPASAAGTPSGKSALAIDLPNLIEKRLEVGLQPVQSVPMRYTTEVRIDDTSRCAMTLQGITTKKDDNICWLVIDRKIWTGMLATGEPTNFKKSPLESREKMVIGLSGKGARLYLDNPAYNPRYPVPASALGNHVVRYTENGIGWIDFE